MYFIVLYLINFKNQVGVFWKSFQESLNSFHLKSYLLKSVHKKEEHLKNFVKNFNVHSKNFCIILN